MPLIVIEGIDGAGKSTIAHIIHNILIKQNKKVILTREPGGLKIAESIRDILLSKKNSTMEPWTETLLYLAARMEHVSKVITPSLKQDLFVICDRFTDSTLAYQGYGRGVNISKLSAIQNLLIPDVNPDLIIFVDMNYEEVVARLVARGQNTNRFDLESKLFFDKVYNGFKQIISSDSENKYFLIKGDLSKDQTTTLLKTVLKTKWNFI